MSDETRPDEGDTSTDTGGEQNTAPDDVSAGHPGEHDDAGQDTHEDTLPALDADDNPDELAGDLTEPDIDLSFLEVDPDEDGGDDDA